MGEVPVVGQISIVLMADSSLRVQCRLPDNAPQARAALFAMLEGAKADLLARIEAKRAERGAIQVAPAEFLRGG